MSIHLKPSYPNLKSYSILFQSLYLPHFFLLYIFNLHLGFLQCPDTDELLDDGLVGGCDGQGGKHPSEHLGPQGMPDQRVEGETEKSSNLQQLLMIIN